MNFGIDIGMLGGQVSGGSLSVNALAGVTVTNPDADRGRGNHDRGTDGDANGEPGDDYTDGDSKCFVPGQCELWQLCATGTPTLLLNSSNIYQSATNQMTYNTAFNQLTPFGSMGAADVLPAIGQIATSFAAVIGGSPLGTTSLPFVPSRSFGSLLDFAGIFSSNISDVLSSGGTATFHNAQTLQQQWATALGVSPASLNGSYDPATHLLTWHIAKSETTSATSSPLDLSAGLQPLTLTSSSGSVTITANASLDTVIGIRLDPMVAKITGAAALPGDGRFVGTSTFQIAVGDAAPVTVTVNGTSTNTNVGIDDIVADFNAALATAGLSQDVIARRNGLRLSFETLGMGVAPKITLSVDSHDVMATQFGFSDGQTNQASVLPQVFIQNASVSGSASAIVSGITATGRLGMLGVGISGGSGVMSMAGGFQLSGSGSTVAGSQVTADDLKTNAVTNLGGFAKALTLDGSALLTLPITVNDGFLSLRAAQRHRLQ